MALLTIKDPTSSTAAALAPAAADTDGDAFKNTGKELLLLTNTGDSAPVTVTIERPTPSNYGVVSDVTVQVAAETSVVVGPFPTGWFNDEDGLVQIGYSAASDMEVSVIRGR